MHFSSFQGGVLVTVSLGIVNRTSVCAASMLTHTRAVTAAHCWWDGFHRAVELTVVYGSLHLFSGGTRVTTRTVSFLVNSTFCPIFVYNASM